MTHDNTGIEWRSVTAALPDGRQSLPDRQELRNWGLVLAARGIPYRFVPERDPADVEVPAAFTAAARHEISLFLKENRQRPAVRRNAWEPADNTLTSLSVLLVLGIFHNLTYFRISAFGHAAIDWLDLGSAHNVRVLDGEWWRIVTALTLHADGLHLLGNLLIGGYFVVRLCQQTGTGFGWLLILASGALGNILNALVQDAGHNAVGASTAIFGAIGIAGAIGTIRSRRHLVRFWFLPLMAAGALLGFLGVGAGDGNTDVGAHLFGFLCGILLGVPAGFYLTANGIPGKTTNALLALATVAIVVISWAMAL